MKKIFVYSLFLFISFSMFSQELQKKFIKGNIGDKITAVRESTGEESVWLTNQALNFVLENKSYIGNDRELDGLSVAAVLSITPEYTRNLNNSEKSELLNKLIKIFSEFQDSNTVQIAIITKIVSLDSFISTQAFLSILNNYLLEVQPQTADSDILKTVITSVGKIGDNISFTILYNDLNDRRYTEYYPEIEDAIINLIPSSRNEVLQIVHSKDVTQVNKILNLIQKNPTISQNFLSEIAENILIETILMMGNSSEITELVELQTYSFKILNDNRWTRASDTALSFFAAAKTEYNEEIMTEDQFVSIITSLVNIAPVDSVNPLIKYLGELNSQVERGQNVSQSIVLAVINTLGAIGDKSAFDSLLSVTYLDYSESVLSAARKALAGLRW